jgi:hypothetical protein
MLKSHRLRLKSYQLTLKIYQRALANCGLTLGGCRLTPQELKGDVKYVNASAFNTVDSPGSDRCSPMTRI